MRRALKPPSMAISRWTRGIAAFSVLLIITALVLHRIFGMPTLVALNLVKVGYAVALVAFILSLIATYAIWRTGASGGGNVALGATLSVVVLLSPLVVVASASNLPTLNDVTTDVRQPPPFQKVSSLRPPGANPVAYPGGSFITSQQEYYPDIEPLEVDRPANETFGLVVDALKRVNLEIVREDPPAQEGQKTGYIEAIDRTLVLGFYDDVAVRVVGDKDRSRIDLRSASRFGQHDLGRNAERLRSIMRQIVVRLEETVPAAEAAAERNKPKLKSRKSSRPAQSEARSSRARARARARRERARRAQQRRRQRRQPSYISPLPGL
jgi:uncharacterized protein (DUF1499 family)